MVSIAAGPVLVHTTNMAHGVSRAIERAISQANEQAEIHAQKHYEARDMYFKRKLISSKPNEPDIGTGVVTPPRKQAQSALLLRMAALVKTDTASSSIDYKILEKLFPRWRLHQEKTWDNEEVLKDLVLAVSQLAHSLSFED